MIDENVYERYTNALGVNADLFERAIKAAQLQVSTNSDVQVVYQSLLATYGTQAAQAALEFYTLVRDAYDLEEYVPDVPEDRNYGLYNFDVDEAIKNNATLKGTFDNLRTKGVQRIYERADETIYTNAKKDSADARWALVPKVGACGWCVMIASNGFMYASQKTVDKSRHPNCKCTPVVDFESHGLKGYDDEALYKQYKSAREAIEQDAQSTWAKMTDEERAKYGNKRRGAYDHYLRNRIAGQINKASLEVKPIEFID